MKRWVVVGLCVLAVLLIGCNYPRWRVTEQLDTEAGPVYTVCPVRGEGCSYAVPIGTGKLPRVGMVGYMGQDSSIHFGRRYVALNIPPS